MLLLSHPTGNANVRHALRAFHEAGLLDRFVTTIALPPWLPFGRRRQYDLPYERVKSHPWREVVRLLPGMRSIPFIGGREKGWASLDAICRCLDLDTAKQLHRQEIRAVYTYEDSALASLQMARKLGKLGIYELPIAYGPHARHVLQGEALKRPDWAFTMEGLIDSNAKMKRKTDELRNADVIICPSPFVRDSLPDAEIRHARILLNPYGAEVMSDSPVSESKTGRDGPLKVLFVGSMTQRKGLADVLEAARRLPSDAFELHILGTPLAPLSFYRKVFSSFVYHPPCPRSEVLHLMRSCDVFVLPSLVEGRALVQLEALSCGLPIVVTANAGGSDLVVDGETGFLIDPGCSGQLVERLQWFIRHRDALPAMSRHARRMAVRHDWALYRQRLVSEVSHALLN
jgi:glycosyltransferase involved in cell wall biosynthesis